MPREYETRAMRMGVGDRCKCEYDIEVKFIGGMWRYPNYSNPSALRHLIACKHGNVGDCIEWDDD